MIPIFIRSFSLICDQMSTRITCGHLMLVGIRTCTPHTYTYVAQYNSRSKHCILPLYWRMLEFELSVLCCDLMWGKHTSASTENEEERYTFCQSKRSTCHHGSVLDQLLGKRFGRCSHNIYKLLFTNATIWVIDLQRSNRTMCASEKLKKWS